MLENKKADVARLHVFAYPQILVPLLSGERAKGPEDNIQRRQPEQDQEPLSARHDARREIDEQTQVAEIPFEPGFPVAFKHLPTFEHG